ncbi:MAG: S41 family peptidase [Candidatus Nanosyncoccaceae bacterium]|jgi:carboxyl-terminal processing protease
MDEKQIEVMRKRWQKQIRINYFIIAIFALVIGVALGFNKEQLLPAFMLKEASDVPDWSLLERVYRKISKDYDGKIDKSTLVEYSAKGLVAGLDDEHSVYMTKDEAKRFKEDLTGEIGGGIGAEIGIRDGNLTVVRPLKNNPAVRAGVEAGDVILKVDDEDVTGQALEPVIMRIRGEPGTDVKLTLYRINHNEPIEISIKREIVDNPSVELDFYDNIAIVTVYRFDEGTVGLMRKAINQLKQNEAKGVILDLRDNGGGVLTAAQGVAGMWIDGQVVLTQKRFSEVVETIYAPSGQAELKNTPTIVLINENSASASEILAAALRDYNKAQLVGVKTYGKGSVQELVSMAGGGQLKLTVAHWFTAKDATIEKAGIEPDIEIERQDDEQKTGKDSQLEKALDLLR